jgi:hypothetical protein
MSRMGTVEANCPECGRSQRVTVCHSINVTVSPNLKDELFQDKINTFSCEQCGKTIRIALDLLYHDMDKGIKICEQYSDVDMKELEGSVESRIASVFRVTIPRSRYKRIVRSREDLKEKIMIFDDGFDDRVMEFLKVAFTVTGDLNLEPGTPIKIYYSGKAEEQSLLLSVLGERGLLGRYAVPVSQYDKMANSIVQLLDKDGSTENEWLLVDREYVRSLVDASGEGRA